MSKGHVREIFSVLGSPSRRYHCVDRLEPLDPLGGVMDKSKFTQTLAILTTKIFCCPGWARQSTRYDRLGSSDLLFWSIFGLLGAGWYFTIFEPQRLRNEM